MLPKTEYSRINKQRKSIELDRQAKQPQRRESPTVTLLRVRTISSSSFANMSVVSSISGWCIISDKRKTVRKISLKFYSDQKYELEYIKYCKTSDKLSMNGSRTNRISSESYNVWFKYRALGTLMCLSLIWTRGKKRLSRQYMARKSLVKDSLSLVCVFLERWPMHALGKSCELVNKDGLGKGLSKRSTAVRWEEL